MTCLIIDWGVELRRVQREREKPNGLSDSGFMPESSSSHFPKKGDLLFMP